MNDLTFKEVTDEYLNEILEIYNYYVLNTEVTFHVRALSIDEMRDLVYYDEPKYKTYLIFHDNILAGYVMLSRYKNRDGYNNSAEISIYLKTEYCGKGIGSRAIKYVEDVALANKIHTLIAGICGNNTSSIKLFEKNGYVKCALFREVGYKFGKYLDVYYYQKIL